MSQPPPAAVLSVSDTATATSFAATTAAAATAENDPLQAALLEAECLMKSLGSGSFAIDSDDEEEGTTTNTDADKKPASSAVMEEEWHPLHENYVPTPPPVLSNSVTAATAVTSMMGAAAASLQGVFPGMSHTSTTTTTASNAEFTNRVPPVPSLSTHLLDSTVSGSMQTAAAAAPSPVYNNYQTTTSNHYSTTLNGVSSCTPTSQHNPATAVTMDGFKASTSRFASNLAQMAQRAANQVSTAVATTTLQQASPTALSTLQSNNQAAALHYPATAYAIGATTPTAAVAALPFSHQAQSDAVAASSSSLSSSLTRSTELDAEQKAALVATHVGPLLPGESIIMFLQNVQHVSDSTGFQYNESAMSTLPSPQWCCAMTFYRLVLFSTHPVSTPPCPVSWNAACWPGQGSAASSSSSSTQPLPNLVLQMPLANMDKVEKSVFTATMATGPNSSSSGGGYGTLAVGTTSAAHTGMTTNTTSNTSGMLPTPTVTTTTLLGLILHDKLNGRQLRFTTTAYPDTNRAYEALQTYAFPGRRNLGYLFAFESKREMVQASVVTDSATGTKQVTVEPVQRRFDAVSEYTRQFTNASHYQLQSSMPWSIWTNTNASYQVCLSYPSVLAGPASLDETLVPDALNRVIRPCAAFRSEQRLPALSWCGPGGSSIWRCSQPKIGLQGNRSAADELYLKHVLERAAAANAAVAAAASNPLILPPRSVLVQLTGSPDLSNWLAPPHTMVGLKILDLRPRSSAMANRTGGYGYENTSNYPGCSLQFCNIGNIHAVRDAYQKLSQLCLSTVSNDLNFATAVEDTKWLSHIRLIWAAAWETAYWVHVHKLPVLVHCSHGWDRTSQVASLAQLLLDPHYRTRAGFATLVEKDFMSFGHPFHTRCGHGEGRDGAGHSAVTGSGLGSTMDEGQISPILIQFLDAVYQVVRLYPEAFEFNTKYLLLLSEHVYSCRFGNFLCDTEREREAVAGIRQRTHSVWDYLEESRSDTLNAQFDSATTGGGVLLMPLSTLLRNIVLWTDRHCMYSPKPTTRWLPLHVHRSIHALHNDQPSDLITDQEMQQLLCTMPVVLLTSADSVEEEPASAVRGTVAAASTMTPRVEPTLEEQSQDQDTQTLESTSKTSSDVTSPL
jgi:Myotubularin-like phosphatase domain